MHITCMHTHTHTGTHTYTHIEHVVTHTHTNTGTRMYTHVCIQTDAHARAHTHTHTHTFVHGRWNGKEAEEEGKESVRTWRAVGDDQQIDCAYTSLFTPLSVTQTDDTNTAGLLGVGSFQRYLHADGSDIFSFPYIYSREINMHTYDS